MQRVGAVTVAVSCLIALFFALFAFHCEQLGSIQIFEAFQVGKFVTMKEEAIAGFWIFTEEAQNIWNTATTTPVYLIEILISLMVVYSIYRKKKEAENELAQMKFLIQSTETLMRKARENAMHTQQIEEGLREEIWGKIGSAKKIMDGEGRFRARIRNETGELKKAMKKREEFCGDLEKSVYLMKKRVTTKRRLDIDLQNDIYSLQRMLLPEEGEIYCSHYESQMDSAEEPTTSEQDSAEEPTPAEQDSAEEPTPEEQDSAEEPTPAGQDSAEGSTPAELTSGALALGLFPGQSGDNQEMHKTEKKVQISNKPAIQKAVRASVKSRRNMFPKSR
jgi:hypothetical protein